MKNSRQDAIIQLITNNNIETQNQLISALSSMGIKSTQATVSRDIKELHIVKELTHEGTYRYAVAVKKELQNHVARLRTIFSQSVTSCVAAGNIIVLKTLPGLASAACSSIDNMKIDKIAGTIGGDDTAFICMYTDEDAQDFCEEIRGML